MPVDIDPTRDLAHLAYTGGTTGVSKGVMLTHRNVICNVMQFGNWFSGAQVEYRDGVLKAVLAGGCDLEGPEFCMDCETALVVVPWFHAMGTVGYLNNMVYSGATMVVFPRFDAQEYIGGVAKFKATVLGGGSPTLYPSGKSAGVQGSGPVRHQNGRVRGPRPWLCPCWKKCWLPFPAQSVRPTA